MQIRHLHQKKRQTITMTSVERKIRCALAVGVAIGLLICFTGCQPFDLFGRTLHAPLPPQYEPPNEKKMVTLSEYCIAPPDVLQINSVKLIPKPPYRVEMFDVLRVRSSFSLPDFPINDFYLVDEAGDLDIGTVYGGKVHVLGMPLDEVSLLIQQKLRDIIREPKVTVQLARTGGTQQIDGVYLVQPGGVINLKQYGMVSVAGKTVVEAQLAIEERLQQFFDNPHVGVTVSGFNSAKYFVIFEGSIQGEDVISLPITGKETVLDALSSVGGLQRAASQDIWISRPAQGDFGCEQILPVDYMAITRGGSSTTNYQLMPGDRLFIAEDGQIALNNYVQKVTAPVYTLLGISQLGASTVRGYQATGRAYNLNRRGF
jgi:polysaccharide export outer membrane protein